MRGWNGNGRGGLGGQAEGKRRNEKGRDEKREGRKQAAVRRGG